MNVILYISMTHLSSFLFRHLIPSFFWRQWPKNKHIIGLQYVTFAFYHQRVLKLRWQDFFLFLIFHEKCMRNYNAKIFFKGTSERFFSFRSNSSQITWICASSAAAFLTKMAIILRLYSDYSAVFINSIV